MGQKPSGPWRRVADGDPHVDLGPYEAAPHLFKYAILYAQIARVSGGAIGPDVVDGWESWQTTSYCGIGLPVPDEAQPGATGGRDVMAEHATWLEARAQGIDLPPPEPDMPDRVGTEALMASFMAPGGGGTNS